MSTQAIVRVLPHFYFIELDRNHPHRYAENSVWDCLNHATGKHTRIGGGLAQVLEKYQDNFQVRLIAAPALTKGD